MVNKYKDIYSSAVFLLLSIAMYVMTYSIQYSAAEALGPAFFPKVIAILLAILSIMLLFKSIKNLQKEKGNSQKNSETIEEKKSGLKINYPLVLTAAILIAYMLLLKTIGFIILSSIYLVCQTILISAKEDINKKNIIRNAVISIVISVAVYYVFFYAFDIFLPAGLLG